MRIGLFDSGLGGLTVLKEFKKFHPKNEYIYFGDNKNLPYGSKTKKELYELSCKNIDFLISKKVDIIVIACGTVSANVYEDLKNKYDIPIYDIVSPTIDYINNSDFKNIGLMATQATVSSNKFKDKITKNVIQQACPLLVPFIEKENSIDIVEVLKEYLSEMKDADAIVLGCTHYPILEKNIQNITSAKLINMGNILCNSLKIIDSIESTKLYFSNLSDKLIANINNIIDFEYEVEEVKNARVTRS